MTAPSLSVTTPAAPVTPKFIGQFQRNHTEGMKTLPGSEFIGRTGTLTA